MLLRIVVILLIIGVFGLMGDRPVPEPFTNSCPSGPYANGLEPDVIPVQISGCTKTAYWVSGYPEPPNGTWQCQWVSCGTWMSLVGDWQIVLQTYGGNLYLTAKNSYSDFGFDGSVSLTDVFTIINVNSMGFMYSSEGVAGGQMFLSGEGLPSSWDAASLVGVPESDGYFAEEFSSDIASRRLRYANHFDGTNVKVYME